MITLDTSALFAILSSADEYHQPVSAFLETDPGPYWFPVSAMGELTYLVEHRLRPVSLIELLANIEAGGFFLDCGENDIPRIRQLIQRYAGFPLGFVDAAVIACAERHGGRVLATDFRHFGAVARGGTITLPLLK
ncbi:MAG TPA: PIN domain-containing protein [Thermomicrobiales bacterium]|nr:PIN domain-containing protein [Thermomicrobiales bacterium]